MTCMNYTRPALAITIDPIRSAFSVAKKRGVKLRYLTEITRDNISYCKELMSIVDGIRHLDGIKGNFMISESEYLAPIILFEKGKIASEASNQKELVDQHQYIFDTLWNKAILTKDRIYELENGIEESPFIETIRDPVEVQMVAFSHMQSAKNEILIIFSTANAFYRQLVIAGGMRLCKEAAERNVKIRILTPRDGRIDKIVQELLQDQQAEEQERRIDIRYIEPELQTKTTVIAIDKKFSLTAELKDDTKSTSYEAIGLATYSNSTPTVLSYASIFESIWTQTEFYEQLKTHNKMQKEFINIAAHELRTPIQPILGLTQIIYSNIDADVSPYEKQKQKEMLEVVIRNANRLQCLSEDILDVTRIESQNLNLNLELLNLDEIISNAINDAKRNQQIKDNVNLLYQRDEDDNDSVFIRADRERLNQVISNLINNAIKFTKEGSIIVDAKKQEREKKVIVSVKDTGIGIHCEVLSRLFQKFATKSYQGTGLGIYIAKSIEEAHGGKMWAENNADGKGAIFYFTLPTIWQKKREEKGMISGI
jgi:two-component system sensor histidine kinase VicK